MIFVGEPWVFKKEACLDETYAPVGQFGVFRKYFLKEQDEYTLNKLIQKEYLAIIETMLSMKIDFRIIYTNLKRVQDMQTIAKCIEKKNRDLLYSFDTKESPAPILYPNLISLAVKNFIMVNDEAEMFHKKKENILVSYYGNGAMAIADNDYIFVAQRQIKKNETFIPSPDEINVIESRGVKVCFLPLPAVVSYKFLRNKKKINAYPDENLDHVLALLKDKKGKEYLLVEPNIRSFVWDEDAGSSKCIDSQETIDIIKKVFSPSGIEVVLVNEINIPLALRFRQFADGRVLITKGEDQLVKIIGEIIGPENVFQTPVPIVYYPVWFCAGIKCLVSTIPDILCE